MDNETTPSGELSQQAASRYQVVPAQGVLWPWAVVCGNGTRELLRGSKSCCKRVACELTTAFLDGAFVGESKVLSSRHTLEDDFQHFMAYSCALDPEARLRLAYEHGSERGGAQRQPAPVPAFYANDETVREFANGGQGGMWVRTVKGGAYNTPLYTTPQPSTVQVAGGAIPGGTLEDNVKCLLDQCRLTVRDMSGERTGSRGVEDLAGSLSITFLGMQRRLSDAQAALAAQAASHEKQLNAQKSLIQSLENQRTILREGAAKWAEAVKSLLSEREANAILTDEITRLTTERDAALLDVVRLAAEKHALKQGDARYQLLRRGQHWSVINGIGDELRAEHLDAAADAALAKESGK